VSQLSPGLRGVKKEANDGTAASFTKAEYTVINIGEEERPRLISCVKSGQGFDWNQGMLLSLHYATLSTRLLHDAYNKEGRTTNAPRLEIFLPSYADYHFDSDLETRRDPVTDIIVTDEEIGKMFPE
jgi:hypothetical protein